MRWTQTQHCLRHKYIVFCTYFLKYCILTVPVRLTPALLTLQHQETNKKYLHMTNITPRILMGSLPCHKAPVEIMENQIWPERKIRHGKSHLKAVPSQDRVREQKWFPILSLSLSLIFLSGSSLVTLNGWRNSLLTHAYCWQIVPLRSRPCRVICASRCYVESLNHIGKGHHGNRQTSPRGAFEENYIFQG